MAPVGNENRPRARLFGPETDAPEPEGVRYVRAYLVDNGTLDTPVFTAMARDQESGDVECVFLAPVKGCEDSQSALDRARKVFDPEEVVVFLVPERLMPFLTSTDESGPTLIIGADTAAADPVVYPQVAVLLREAKNLNGSVVSLFDTKTRQRSEEAFSGEIEVFTDGSYYTRWGIGSAAAVTSDGSYVVEYGHHIASSGAAEAAAIALAITHLPWDLPVTVYSDSKHLVQALNGPERPGSISTAPWPLREILKPLKRREAPTSFCWVKGHSTSTMNNVADRLARSASRGALYGTEDETSLSIFPSIVASAGLSPTSLVERSKSTRSATSAQSLRHSLSVTDNSSENEKDES